MSWAVAILIALAVALFCILFICVWDELELRKEQDEHEDGYNGPM